MKPGRKLVHAALGAAATWMMTTATASAQLNIAEVPLFMPGALPPRVMLGLSKDHEMFKEAYPDYSDMDGDGAIDSTYKDSFDYYGYFDSSTCYTYGSGRFTPVSSGSGTNGHHCGASSGRWSGNFLNWATMTRMDIVRRVLYGGYRYIDTETETVLQRELIPNSAHAFVKIFSGTTDTAVGDVTPFSGPVSMCNVTWESSSRSDEVDVASNPPQMRVASGEWTTWAATEVIQCAWESQKASGSPSSAHPQQSGDGLGAQEYAVRVEVCDSSRLESNCRAYPQGTYKPIGLLQRYGENDKIHFGLLTGSYQKNTSGGVLRRNIGPLTGNTSPNEEENEVDPQTGIFANTDPGDQSIVNAVNRLRLTHWDYASNAFADNCGSPGITSITDNQCTNWGNPVGEMVLETLRYFAGATGPTGDFDTSDSTRLPGLPHASNWRDPLSSDASCANPNLILLSSGVSTHDAGLSGNYGSASSIPSLGSSGAVATRTNEVGSGEGISGQYILGGSDNQCSAETISGLAGAQGICPEAPSLKGGYSAAGLTYDAWINDLRPEYADREQNVKTYAVNLAEPLPRLRFGDIELLPACQSKPTSSTSWNTCSAVQTDVVDASYNASGELVSGRFRTFWEDSTYGSDYDMDGVGELTICRGGACGVAGVSGDEVQVTVDVVQAYAGFDLRFGFLASGSLSDGLSTWVLRPGGNNFSVLVSPEDNPTNQPLPVTTVLAPGTSSATLLNDPLWYAAKWGGFDKEPGSTPSAQEQWDADADGTPDNYYLVRNPARLEQDLDNVFSDIISGVSSASSVATNSTRLDTETLIYQARFKSDDWTGQLLAYPLDSDGTLGNVAWDAADLIPAPDSRDIFTMDGSGNGITFAWNQLTSSQQAALDTSPDGVTDGRGEERLAWLRGDRSQELQNGGLFRDRSAVLGDIVNSDPVFAGAQNFGYDALPSGTAGRTTYQTFRLSKVDNVGKVIKPMIYVGANDGMLHGFDATTGVERFAYVPSTLVPEMNELPDRDYAHRYFVDGQIFIGDAFIERGGTDQWRTVLVGATGAGGRTVYALDVTDPHNFGTDDVLWEFTDPDLGYTIGEPVVARLADGTWAAIFGNGYNSDNHNAVLFIVDLETGSLITKIGTGTAGAGTATNPNGLSTPSLLADGTRTIRAAYAGDLHGNVWKFDLSASNGSWGVAFKQSGNPAPLFIARDSGGNRQPITSPIEIGRHPEGGHMIFLGTGQFFETGDNLVGSTPQVQSFYGLWDQTGSNATPISGRTELVEQAILQEMVPSNSQFEVRVTSEHSVDWSTKRGWYIDLVSPSNGAEGERVVAAPILRAGRIIFPTLIPSPDPCGLGGTSWLMEMDAVSGARLQRPPLDITEDGEIDSDDMVTVQIDGQEVTVPVSAVRSREGIVRTPAVISAGETEYKLASGTSGNVETLRERGLFDRARGSWRQLR